MQCGLYKNIDMLCSIKVQYRKRTMDITITNLKGEMVDLDISKVRTSTPMS